MSQLMSAVQMVVEEKFLKGRNLPPEFVVGVEGTFGACVMLAVVLPAVGAISGEDGDGVHESAVDAAHLFASSGKLASLVLAYWISIAFYNFCGLAVAKKLSSVHRCLVDACRTIVVWSVDLLLFKVTAEYGEAWDPDTSWIQLLGFCVMVFGAFVYAQPDPNAHHPPDPRAPARLTRALSRGRRAPPRAEQLADASRLPAGTTRLSAYPSSATTTRRRPRRWHPR